MRLRQCMWHCVGGVAGGGGEGVRAFVQRFVLDAYQDNAHAGQQVSTASECVAVCANCVAGKGSGRADGTAGCVLDACQDNAHAGQHVTVTCVNCCQKLLPMHTACWLQPNTAVVATAVVHNSEVAQRAARHPEQFAGLVAHNNVTPDIHLSLLLLLLSLLCCMVVDPAPLVLLSLFCTLSAAKELCQPGYPPYRLHTPHTNSRCRCGCQQAATSSSIRA